MKFDNPGLTFDDVLLKPQWTDIPSRFDSSMSTKTQLTRQIDIDIPIITSNMDTVTESAMMIEMAKLGGCAILHRFMEHKEIINELTKARESGVNNTFFSVGTNHDSGSIMNQVYKEKLATGVCIDVAHGAHERVLNLIIYIKDNYPDWQIIAGNVATGNATERLIKAGADAIKVGIGPGSMCTTRKVTGCGIPQLTAIDVCARTAEVYDTMSPVPIIADGGIRNSGDMIKALAAGASSVMVGSMVAGCDETPGDIIAWGNDDYPYVGSYQKSEFKKYQGMASRDAMSGWKGKSYDKVAPEGESKLIECKGPVVDIINELVAGLRSGMTYNNARNIEQLQENAVFIPISSLAFGENGAHGLNL